MLLSAISPESSSLSNDAIQTLISSNSFVNDVVSEATVRFNQLIADPDNVQEICGTLTRAVPPVITLSERTITLEPITVSSTSVNQIGSSLCEVDMTPSDRRCLCDESVSGMNNPCSSVESLDGMSGGSCHPNQCTTSTSSPTIGVVLDMPVDQFTDEDLTDIINTLNSNLPSGYQVIVKQITSYPGSYGATTELELTVEKESTYNDQILQQLFEDILDGKIQTSIPIVTAEEPTREASTPATVAIPVPVPNPAPIPVPRPVGAPISFPSPSPTSSRVRVPPGVNDNSSVGTVITSTVCLVVLLLTMAL